MLMKTRQILAALETKGFRLVIAGEDACLKILLLV